MSVSLVSVGRFCESRFGRRIFSFFVIFGRRSLYFCLVKVVLIKVLDFFCSRSGGIVTLNILVCEIER